MDIYSASIFFVVTIQRLFCIVSCESLPYSLYNCTCTVKVSVERQGCVVGLQDVFAMIIKQIIKIDLTFITCMDPH